MAERYQQNLEKAAAPLIDGPLIVATIGSPVGSMSHLFSSEAFNLGLAAAGGGPLVTGMTHGKMQQRDTKDVRLPQSFAVVLTPTSVYFFKWKPFWGRVKLKRELARMPREGLQVKIAKGRATATTFLLVSESAGMRTAFEMATLGMAKAKAKVQEVVTAFAPEIG
ncbi:MAG TPA: hypothetical protein VG298_12895 [Acidimicrobiales bacterium]|jgi:hypothetical protein|nr:hypothetical protein [Acidimicrobiales bacterium]